jgi:nitroreductase
MDTWLAVASRREVREYADRELPEEVVNRILDAGRLAGSARNRQPWRFLVVDGAEARERLADAVYEPANVRGARLVVAILGGGGLDTGRAMQNMLLTAWNEGVGSCPNGIAGADGARDALGLDEEIAIVLTFGYPSRPADPARRTPEEWSARANRKPLAAVRARARACRSARRPSSGPAQPPSRRAAGRCRSPGANPRR